MIASVGHQVATLKGLPGRSGACEAYLMLCHATSAIIILQRLHCKACLGVRAVQGICSRFESTGSAGARGFGVAAFECYQVEGLS